LDFLIKLGLLDYSKITTAQNKTGLFFPTTPHVWGAFGAGAGSLGKDLVDDAKLFLNSLRYGQFYSDPSRGKIKSPEWIVNALLRDGAIGVRTPATAIGEDYPLALSRGIVNIVESKIYPGRYSMELLKGDVVEAVGDVLEHQTLLPTEKAVTDEDIEKAGRFISPKSLRVQTELPAGLKECHDELVFGLRTMRKRNR
jgi:hypothetical protein